MSRKPFPLIQMATFISILRFGTPDSAEPSSTAAQEIFICSFFRSQHPISQKLRTEASRGAAKDRDVTKDGTFARFGQKDLCFINFGRIQEFFARSRPNLESRIAGKRKVKEL